MSERLRSAARGANPEWLLAALSACLLVAGGALALGGAPEPAKAIWIAAGALGGAVATRSIVGSLLQRRIGVDPVALLAVVGTLAVAEYLAAAVIGLMLTTGRSLESWAAGRARRDLRTLLERAPRFAHKKEPGGGIALVDVEDIVRGDNLVVGASEIVPVDGTLLASAVLDESVLSGESKPVERDHGEPVRSGVVNAGPPFELRATDPAAESSYAGVVRLVSEAESHPGRFVRLADRYALWFFVATLVGSALAWAAGGPERAVAVLVVATPCPLILAAPVAFVGGLSRAARRGIVFKGGTVLERLARCTTLLIDKTGTLTTGRPALSSVLCPGDVSPGELLCLAGSLEQVSPHLLAQALVKAALSAGCELRVPEQVEEVAGRGIRGLVDGHRVALGKVSWAGITSTPAWVRAARRRARLDGSLVVFVSVDDEPAGALVLDDPIRYDAARTIRSLRRSGIERVVMLSGDRQEVAETVGAVLGVDDVLAERSPSEKLDVVREERTRAPTVMVGDGVNDAPALALADVGVAMGARGATASSETADVVLTVDKLDRVGEARSLARRSRRIALESVVAGMVMSLGAMGVAAVGLLPALWGAILQEGIDAAVIVNALRSLGRPGEARSAEAGQSALASRFHAEHETVRAQIDRLRSVADSLGELEPSEAMDQVSQVHKALVRDVLPHEQAEGELLYPAIDRLVGGRDPTGPMSRGHVEIAHQVRRLGQLLDEIGPQAPHADDLVELRRALYGLAAILGLHTTQEEESYLSLGDVADEAPPTHTRGSDEVPGAKR